MKSRENLIFQISAKRSFRRLATKLAVAACAALAVMIATGTSPARAASVPYHNYSGSCTGLWYLPGDSHPYYLIKIHPERIDAEAKVETQYLNSPTYHQYIYFWLWV